MNDLKMDWLAYAKTASASDGVFTTDVKGRSFILEWKKSDILSPSLAALKKIYPILQARNCLQASSHF